MHPVTRGAQVVWLATEEKVLKAVVDQMVRVPAFDAVWSSGETVSIPSYSKMVIVDPLSTENVASVHLAGRVTVPMSR